MARSGINFFLGLAKPEKSNTLFSLSDTEFSNDFVYPIDFWFAIARVNPGAFHVLVQVSRLLQEGLDSDFAWKERVRTELTSLPIVQLRGYRSAKEFFQHEYKKLNMAALNKGLLDAPTPKNHDDLFAMLEKSIEEGLEQFAKRLIQRLPSTYFTVEKCIKLFSNQGFYTHNNPEIRQLLLAIIEGFPQEVRYRILAQGFFSCLHIEESNFIVASPAVASIVWQQLPQAIRKTFFVGEIPPWFDLISGKMPGIADDDKRRLMNALLLTYGSAKFSNIQFLLDDMPANEVVPTARLALTIQYFVTQTKEPGFISQTTNSIRVLLNVLPADARYDFTTSFYDAALSLFHHGLNELPNLRLAPVVLAYLQNYGVPSRSVEPETILARLLYGECLSATNVSVIEARLATLENRMQGVPLRHGFVFSSLIFDALKHAIAGQLPLEPITKLIEKCRDFDFAACLLYHVLAVKCDVEAIKRYINALRIVGLALPVCKRFIMQTCSGSNEPLILNFDMEIFKLAVAIAPDSPWREAMTECLKTCFNAHNIKRFLFYTQRFSSYSFFVCAVKNLIEGEPKKRQVEFFKQLFPALQAANLTLIFDCWNLCIQFGAHYEVIREFSKTLTITPEVLCKMAAYDANNKSNLLRMFLSLLRFDAAMLAIALHGAANNPDVNVMPTLLKAIANPVNHQLEVTFKYMVEALILEKKEKHLKSLSEVFRLSDKKNQESIIRMLLQTSFFCAKRPLDLEKLLNYLKIITAVTNRSDLQLCVAGYIYDLLAISNKKKEGWQLLNQVISPLERDEILLALLHLAEASRNRRVLENLFRNEVGKKFLTEERIAGFEQPLRDFVRETVGPMPKDMLAQVAFWQAKKVVADLQCGVLKSIKLAFVRVFAEYSEKQPDPRSELALAINLGNELLARQEKFKETIKVEGDAVDEFDKFSFKFLFWYLSDVAEESKSKRFLAILSKHFGSLQFSQESESSFSSANRLAFNRIKLLSTKQITPKNTDTLIKALQHEVFASYQNSLMLKVAANRK